MLKTIIKLPDGTQISSGKIMDAAIQSCTITECVNSGEELILGSTCAASLEATVLVTGGDLNIAAGDEVTVCKQDGDNEPVQVGVFILEKPTRTTANTMKITGYDRVSKLDKDLTVWLSGLKEWPYTLTSFARMVCKACGLTFKVTDVPNQDFQVQQFTRSSVTGRQIMQWLGEICARFCRATLDGDIEFAWYADSGKEITTSGELYYFQNGLSYENYEVAKIDAVQLRLADSASGALWPAEDDGANSYIIAGNPILNLQVTEALLPVLANIQSAVANAAYTPCQVNIPANVNIRAGSTVKITDKNGKTIMAYVMSKTQTGQKDTLECTGSRRRDTSASANNKTAAEKTAEAEGYADSAAQSAVDGQTQEQIYLKLTNDEKLKGLFMKDGELYVNASYLKSGKISADLIDGATLNITTGAKIAGWDIDDNSIYSGSFDTGVFMCRGSVGAFNIGGSGSISGWVFGAGGKYGVTSSGSVWCSDIHATGGEIGGWDIKSNRLQSGNGKILLKQDGMTKTVNGTEGDFVIYANGNFGITTDGALYASNAHIKGEIEATSGNVGGWIIGSDYLCGEGSTDGFKIYLYPDGKHFPISQNISHLFFIVLYFGTEPMYGISTSGWETIYPQ